MRTGALRLVAVVSTAAMLSETAAPLAAAQSIERVSVGAGGDIPYMSSSANDLTPDGRFAAFDSYARNLVSRDRNGANDVFRRELATGVLLRFSVATSGAEGDSHSFLLRLSSDGSIGAFQSESTNLVSGDTNNVTDIFLRDTNAATTERISVRSNGAQGNGRSYDASISGDGALVAFTSDATNLVSGDTNGLSDVFLVDRAAGRTRLVSVALGGAPANGRSSASHVSRDGRFVLFASAASNLVAGDGNGSTDLFLYDVATRTVSLAVATADGGFPRRGSVAGAISTDGRFLAFESASDDFGPLDTNGFDDVYVLDRSDGSIVRASLGPGGVEPQADGVPAAVSQDGRFVAWWTAALELFDDKSSLFAETYVWDRTLGANVLASYTHDGAYADFDVLPVAISDDGSALLVGSGASNLVADDKNNTGDAFVRARVFTLASQQGYGSGLAGRNGVPGLALSSAPILGSSPTLDVGNSSGRFAAALLLIGLDDASVPAFGGTLLVDPLLSLTLVLVPAGNALPVDLPADDRLLGISWFLQVLEVDDHAPRGVSMTPGLELIVGY